MLWFNLYKILDLERNNLNTHFCFSELLILREKRFADFLLGHWSNKKNLQIFQNFWKNTIYRIVAQKRYNFSPGAANHTFFTHPVSLYILIFLWCLWNVYTYIINFFEISQYPILYVWCIVCNISLLITINNGPFFTFSVLKMIWWRS